jgi:hypothetical protein
MASVATLEKHLTKLVLQVALLLSRQDKLTEAVETHNTILLCIEQHNTVLSIETI